MTLNGPMNSIDSDREELGASSDIDERAIRHARRLDSISRTRRPVVQGTLQSGLAPRILRRVKEYIDAHLPAWEFRCRTSLDPSLARSGSHRIGTSCDEGSRGRSTCWRKPTWRWQRWPSPPDSQIKVTSVGASENSQVCRPGPFECSIANRGPSPWPASCTWPRDREISPLAFVPRPTPQAASRSARRLSDDLSTQGVYPCGQTEPS
jgi:hypothetical protein